MSTDLGRDEQRIEEASFTPSLVLFWLKAIFILTNKKVTGEKPNTLLGLIPLGKNQIAQPLKTIASVASSTKFHISRLIVGLVLLLIGIATMEASPIIGLIILVLGVISILNCFVATFVITNNSGQSTGYEISIIEKEKVLSFANRVNSVIADL